MEIPAQTTIQIQSANQSLANSTQICIDNMQTLTDVDVRTKNLIKDVFSVDFLLFCC